MYDQLIKERLTNRKILRLERPAPDERARDSHASLMVDHVKDDLRRQLGEMYDEEVAAATSQPLSTARDFGGFRTESQLRKHVTERLRVEMDRPKKVFDYTVPMGSRVFGPPYDVEWQVGSGFAFGSRIDGDVFAIGAPGFSGAGIGFYLSSPETVLAAITPMGTYEFSWASFEDLPYLRSRGGLGVTIYVNTNQQPTISNRAELWSLFGVTRFTGDSRTGRIADAASPATGFGPIPLAPVLLNMFPGNSYLVWVWCWQVLQVHSGAAFLAFLKMSMPFVTIDAGPPIVIK